LASAHHPLDDLLWITNLSPAWFYLQHWLFVPLYLLPRAPTTSATVGIAKHWRRRRARIWLRWRVAGAVISGYFGDKLSPNVRHHKLSSAMAGTDLFTHDTWH
jgi:hypothetical protein